LVKGSHPLLTIKQQGLWGSVFGLLRCSFNWSRLKIYRPASVKRHQCTNRKSSGDRGDQTFDAIFVPDPAALKIRQLKNATVAVFEKLVQVKRVRLKR
jgi:hypothetical protein